MKKTDRIVALMLVIAAFGFVAFLFFLKFTQDTSLPVPSISDKSNVSIYLSQNQESFDIVLRAPDVTFSALALRLYYPLFGISGPAPIIETNTLLSEKNWVFPVSVVKAEDKGEEMFIDLAAINLSTTGFLIDDEIVIATVRFQKGAVPVDKIQFDQEKTKVIDKEGRELGAQFLITRP